MNTLGEKGDMKSLGECLETKHLIFKRFMFVCTKVVSFTKSFHYQLDTFYHPKGTNPTKLMPVQFKTKRRIAYHFNAGSDREWGEIHAKSVGLPSSSVLTVIAGLAGPCPLTVEALTFNEYTVKGSNPSITP